MVTSTLSPESAQEVETQIYELRKTVRYDIRDLTVEQIVSKYSQSLDEDFDEDSDNSSSGIIYIPEYQRDFTWDEDRQSKLIESIILGLPIPFIFVAENKNGHWEIVDGSQRIRTLNSFITNKLKLRKLETLDKLNELYFSHLSSSRQAKIKDTALRLIVLSEETADEVKKDMFERINKGSDLLKPMENRKGSYPGVFTDFIYEYAERENTKARIKLGKWHEKRQERPELLLRFFGLLAIYPKGIHDMGVAKYLDEFLKEKNKELEDENIWNQTKETYVNTIEDMLMIVEKFFPYSFGFSQNSHTKRSVFEAISVGVSIFLRDKDISNIRLDENKIREGISSLEFKKHVRGGSLHKTLKLKGRIDFIIKLLENSQY